VPNLGALLDNDIILKACRYLLTPKLMNVVSACGQSAVLGSAKFVLRHRIARSRGRVDKAAVTAALDALLMTVAELEPYEPEVLLAADFQEMAQLHSLALDPGESLLLAVLVLRPAALLLTGDKRAIVAAEWVLEQRSLLSSAEGKVACLEQIAAELMRAIGPDSLRAKICADCEADMALSICFSCGSEAFSESNALEGLSSYLRELRAAAPRLLVHSDDLSSIPT
jgi:hypothetical protein